MMSTILRKQSQRPKKFLCDFKDCNKSYTRPCLLEQHIRTHSNERPFQCDKCPKSFFRDSHLKVHLWTHSDEKPLQCSVCSKGFVTSQQLSRHMKKHPKESMAESLSTAPSTDTNTNTSTSTNTPQREPTIIHKCPYECEQTFTSDRLLSAHMLSEHVMSDIVDEDVHKLQNQDPTTQIAPSPLDIPDIKDVLTPEMYQQLTEDAKNVKRIDDFGEWGNHLCKEPICDGYPGFESYQDLIFHYDHFHRFIPESLYQNLELNEEIESSSSGSISNPNINSNIDYSEFPQQLIPEPSLQFPQITTDNNDFQRNQSNPPQFNITI